MACAPPAAPVARTGYRDFGSFHTEVPVEDMVASADWAPPPNPCAAPTGLAANTPLGAALRPHFLIDFER